ncbi:MAG: hypothetical protein L0287_32870, partial [Anaerolineae bacterium]|nr:hypothetical protein [Anaerolineae bacterium]
TSVNKDFYITTIHVRPIFPITETYAPRTTYNCIFTPMSEAYQFKCEQQERWQARISQGFTPFLQVGKRHFD